MSISIFENFGNSICFTIDRFFGRIGDWYLLLVICLLSCSVIGIPLLQGYFVRVLRGDSSFKSIGQMFMDGIGVVVAVFTYLIPVVLVFLLAVCGGFACIIGIGMADASGYYGVLADGIGDGFAGIIGTALAGGHYGVFADGIGDGFAGIIGTALAGGHYGVLAVGILWIILLFALAIIFGSMAIISLIRFAKEDNLSVVTEFRNNFRIAGEIGWLKIILSAIICSLFMMVPLIIVAVLGSAVFALITTIIIRIICVILMIPALFCVPLVLVIVVKYWSNLYDSAITTSP